MKSISIFCISVICGIFVATSLFAQELPQNNTIILDHVDVRGVENGGGSILDKNIQVGSLGQKRVLELPYQVNVISSNIIKDQNYLGLEDVIKLISSAQIEYRGGSEMGRPQTRGMRGSVTENNLWDGFHIITSTAIPASLFSEIQVTSGVTGTIYGAQPPAGTFYYITKRAKENFAASFKTIYSDKANLAQEVDIQGKSKYVGARSNLIIADGEGSVKNSKLRRKFGSLAIDFYLNDKLTLEANAIYYNYVKTGFSGYFYAKSDENGTSEHKMPKAVKSSKAGLGQKYAGVNLKTITKSVKLKYEISDNWYSEIGYLTQVGYRAMFTPMNIFVDDDGGVDVYVPRDRSAGKFKIQSWLATLNTKQDLFNTYHDLSLGANGYNWEFYRNLAKNSDDFQAGFSNINYPKLFPNPGGYTRNVSYKKTGENIVNSITLSDTIKFNKNWQTMLTFGKSWFKYKSIPIKLSDEKERSTQNGNSYAASILFLPTDTLSFYLTYANSIQPGDSGENYDNTTVTLSPYRSVQYEIGAKSAFENIDLSVGIFSIKRPFAYLGNNGIFALQGEQRNYGIEFIGSGEVMEGLNIYGGFTYTDPKIKRALVTNINNKIALGMPKWQANILSIYKLPSFKNISFDANLHYTGKKAIDQANTQWTQSYFTLDLGVKYSTKNLIGKESVFRVSVYNVTNQKYWASIFNGGGLDGEVGSGARMFLGEPRKIMATFEVKF